MMLHESPLRKQHEQFVESLTADRETRQSTAQRPGAATAEVVRPGEIPYIAYAAGEATEAACELVAMFGDIEPEYGAIRKGCGVFDASQYGTIEVTGGERIDFLSRMLTQSLDDLQPGGVRQSFWLNRKGRIDADLTLAELSDRMLISVDINQVRHTVETLDAYTFTEDIALRDASDEFHHIRLDGRLTLETLGVASGTPDLALPPGAARELTIGGIGVTAMRLDTAGQPGVELIAPYNDAETVWKTLLLTDATIGEGKRRIRPIGWYAYNIARIEAGTPIFNVDFGPTNLPHESGLLHERVNFKKGCYLGQEVVARMESLGKPARVLIGFRVHGDAQPVAGAQVFERDADGSMGGQIGVVTSSTLSPMLGAASIGFAMIKTAHAHEGVTVLVNAEGEQAEAELTPLRFWPTEDGEAAGNDAPNAEHEYGGA